MISHNDQTDCFLILNFSEDAQMQRPLVTAKKKDEQLEAVLKQYNMLSLYDTFEKNSVTLDVIWDLEDEYLKDMGMNVVERLLYSKAKKIKFAKQVDGKCYVSRSPPISNFFHNFRKP